MTTMVQKWWTDGMNVKETKGTKETKGYEEFPADNLSVRHWWLRRTIQQSSSSSLSVFPCTDATDYFMQRFAKVNEGPYHRDHHSE
jgi:hypothetical protein